MNFKKKVVEVGNSLAVFLPSDLAKFYDLSKGSEVIISDDDDKIMIKKDSKEQENEN